MHTLGPWTSANSGYEDYLDGIVAQYGVTGTIGETIAYCIGPNSEANTRLIAAAPELLAACQAYIRHYEERQLGLQSVAGALGLRAAIAKATGG